MEDGTDQPAPPGTNHTRRATVVKEADPYRNIWDKHDNYYSEELAKSGAAFSPDYLEMALRSKGTARFALQKARKLNNEGHRILARMAFQEAMTHVKLAKSMMAKHNEVLAKSR